MGLRPMKLVYWNLEDTWPQLIAQWRGREDLGFAHDGNSIREAGRYSDLYSISVARVGVLLFYSLWH